MFARGSRFEASKVPDVPAPNAYNILQESTLENYKRGAFLEKADRFNKDKTEEPQETRRASSTEVSAEHQVVALLKRVEELEKIHLEGKRFYQVELEKLKQELAASRKQTAESATKLEKHRKEKDTSDATIKELKKASSTDQGEIKDLRHKLRLLDLEHNRAIAKQPELNELKDSLRALEVKRREEASDYDRKLADLEKKLQAESKRRELCERKNDHVEEISNLRSALQDKENFVKAVQDETLLAKEQLRQIELDNSDRISGLLQQLENHRSMLETVARQYGILASQSASLTEYNRMKEVHMVLNFNQYRLERKLANSEAQVLELARLIRLIKEENVELSQQLSDAVAEIDHFTQQESQTFNGLHQELQTDFSRIKQQSSDDHEQLTRVIPNTEQVLLTYYQFRAHQFSSLCTVFAKEHSEAIELSHQHKNDLDSALASHEVIASRVESMEIERIRNQEALDRANADMDKLRSSSAILEVQLSDARQRLEELGAAALKQESDVVQRLKTAIQKSRVAEEALRSDIGRLTGELVNAEAYHDAYDRLYDQVGALITRNQIAEDEAERISKLNAEIVGHQNPAQRILYMDRIRSELAEAKMKIAELIRAQENLTIYNCELEYELNLYKSVQIEEKTRTNLTRIARPPLVNLNQSVNTAKTTDAEASCGDMTLEEMIA